MALKRAPYSYRQDPAVPAFADDMPLFLFDGVCVLCSSGVRWLMRYDKNEIFRFATAQSALGQALYRHYGIDMNETYLLIDHGVASGKSEGYLRIARRLGGAWRLTIVFRLMPRALRDWIYDLVARNRYRWFGKTGYCELIPEALKGRLLS